MKNKTMAKTIALLLVLAISLACVACNTGTDNQTPASNVPASNAPASNAPGSNAPSTSIPSNNVPTASEPAGTFLIGTYLQLTGGNAIVGNAAKQGIDLAAKYINENGGFNGATVEILHYDTTGSTEEAVKVVQKMLVNDAVDAVIGSVNSNEVSAVIPYLNEAEIYNFGLGTSATWMADTSRVWTFRASANNGQIAPLGVDLIKQLNFSTVAIINGTDDTGSSTADAFEQACHEKGVTVTTRQQCDSDDTDFSGQISQILATDPDCIYMSLIGTTFGPFVRQLRNSGYKGMLAAKETFNLDYMQVAGIENSNYIFYSYPYVTYTEIADCTIPIMIDFLNRFYAEFNAMPAHEAAYRGWDTMMSMWEASKVAGSNEKTALRDAMPRVKLDGLGGPLDYTRGDREGYSEFYSFVLVDGKNILLDDWLAAGGYQSYLADTGRDR